MPHQHDLEYAETVRPLPYCRRKYLETQQNLKVVSDEGKLPFHNNHQAFGIALHILIHINQIDNMAVSACSPVKFYFSSCFRSIT